MEGLYQLPAVARQRFSLFDEREWRAAGCGYCCWCSSVGDVLTEPCLLEPGPIKPSFRRPTAFGAGSNDATTFLDFPKIQISTHFLNFTAATAANRLSVMKRVREPPERGATTNPVRPRAASPDDHGKRSRQQQQQRRPHQVVEINGNNRVGISPPSSQVSTEHLGPFRALLAVNGVVWPAVPEHGGATGVEAREKEEEGLGFRCRCNPPKMRVGVEKALMHDRARRREFVEVTLLLRKNAPTISYSNSK